MLSCTNCGAALGADDRFCGECGHQVDATAPGHTTHHDSANDSPAHPTQSPASDTATRARDSATRSSRTLIYGAVVLGAIGIGALIFNSGQQNQAPEPTSAARNDAASEVAGVRPQAAPREPAPPSETLQGVIGMVQDAHANAQLCRQNGQCLPAEGTEIETGDSLDSNSDEAAVFFIEGAQGTKATHALEGRIAKFSLMQQRNGSLAVIFDLASGALEGDVSNGQVHLISIGNGRCAIKQGRYRASALSSGATFRIDRGAASCSTTLGGEILRIDASNPVIRWAGN